MASSFFNIGSMFSPSKTLATAATSQVKPKASDTTPTTTSGGLDGTSTGQTFLNLLVKELQNQDPTAPMDSTAMVGQMISLNQLDQLISINQVLSSLSTPATNTTGSKPDAVGDTSLSSSAQMAARAALLNTGQNGGTAMQSMMQSVSDPTQPLDLSTLQIPNGGK